MKLRGFLLIEVIISLAATLLLSSTLLLILKTMNHLNHPRHESAIINFIQEDDELCERIRNKSIAEVLLILQSQNSNPSHNIGFFSQDPLQILRQDPLKREQNSKNSIQIRCRNNKLYISNHEKTYVFDNPEYMLQYIVGEIQGKNLKNKKNINQH